MEISLASISRGKAIKSPRVILLGVDKIGKSTFASKSTNPIFIPIKGETGLDEIESPKFTPALDYAAVIERIAWLCENRHDFKTVCIDSASALEPLVWAETCRMAGDKDIVAGKATGYGQGYILALRQWAEITSGLDYLRDEKGMGVILIGHVRTKSFNDPLSDPYDQWEWTINAKAASLLYAWADATLFATVKSFTRVVSENAISKAKTVHGFGGTDRILLTEKRPGHPGGNRFSGIPPELPFLYAAWQSALDASRATKTQTAV